jgi:hypothetical protein
LGGAIDALCPARADRPDIGAADADRDPRAGDLEGLGGEGTVARAGAWIAPETAPVTAGIACGGVAISAKDNAESPLRVYGPGSNLADHRLLEVTAGGELILAGGAGNGYRLAELMGATNPSGWSGVLKVKTPAGATAGYILLYSNP